MDNFEILSAEWWALHDKLHDDVAHLCDGLPAALVLNVLRIILTRIWAFGEVAPGVTLEDKLNSFDASVCDIRQKIIDSFKVEH